MIDIVLTAHFFSDSATTDAIHKDREWNHKTKLVTDTLKETFGGLMLTSEDILCDIEGTAASECMLQQSSASVNACAACLQAVPLWSFCHTKDTECTAYQNCFDTVCNACSPQLADYADCLFAIACGAGCGSSQESIDSWI